jgi:segregation and condensation protein B
MKKPVKKGEKKAQDANLGNETAPYAPEYAHILAAELEVNPNFGAEEGEGEALMSEINQKALETEFLGEIVPLEPEQGPGWNPIALEGPLDLTHAVEALVFASEKPLDARQITALLGSLWPEPLHNTDIQQVLDELMVNWNQRPGGFELIQTGGGYCFLTRSAFLPLVQKAVLEQSKRKLSVASLETLAIVAYKQPVSKSEVEQIRGVNCDFSIQKLLEKRLIRISGKGDGPGRPTLYSTSDLFMDYFGINSIKQLPQLKDFEQEQNRIGGEDEDAFESDDLAKISSAHLLDSSENGEIISEFQTPLMEDENLHEETSNNNDDDDISVQNKSTDSRDADETYS